MTHSETSIYCGILQCIRALPSLDSLVSAVNDGYYGVWLPLYYLTPNVTPCYTVEEVMKLSSWDKLLARILTLSNDLRFEELRKVLEKFGYTMKAPRSGSSHYTFRKPGCQPITVPKHEPIKKVYVEMVRDVVESEMKNHEND